MVINSKTSRAVNKKKFNLCGHMLTDMFFHKYLSVGFLLRFLLYWGEHFVVLNEEDLTRIWGIVGGLLCATAGAATLLTRMLLDSLPFLCCHQTTTTTLPFNNYPVHSTGFSFYIFPGFFAICILLSSNNENVSPGDIILFSL